MCSSVVHEALGVEKSYILNVKLQDKGVEVSEAVFEKKILVAEGEEACKLFDCFLAYKKLIGAIELPLTLDAEKSVQIGIMLAPETVEAKSRANSAGGRLHLKGSDFV